MGMGPYRTPSITTAMPADASPPPWKLYHNPHFLSDSLHLPLPHETPVFMDAALTLEINDLRAQLDLERRLRRAAESLAISIARDLADERRARADAEADSARCREFADRAIREAEEDRRMLKLAEGWREERVKMKLSHAAVVLEERMREVGEKGMGRKEREKENPHIRRGMNGFVEFSRAIRVRSPGSGTEKERVGRDLEEERAQLRVLMK